MFRPGPLAGDASYAFGGTGSVTNRIQAINADGFEVGSNSDVNNSGTAYYWIAFDVTSKVKVGSYTGNGSDNRNITGVGINPDWVWVKRGATSQSVTTSDAVGADGSSYWSAAFPFTNRIQALIVGGFQVGSDADVNSSSGTTTYYYLAAER
jgi:hypothetical protein